MGRNRKADLRGVRSDEKHLTRKSKRFISDEYTQFPPLAQCKYCRSEYMRFAVNGYCQRCQQHAEHIVREQTRVVDGTDRGGRQ